MVIAQRLQSTAPTLASAWVAGALVAACHPSRVPGDRSTASGAAGSSFALARAASSGSPPSSPGAPPSASASVSASRTSPSAFGTARPAWFASPSPFPSATSELDASLLASAPEAEGADPAFAADPGAVGAPDTQPPIPALPAVAVPFGARTTFPPYACSNMHRSGSTGPFLAAADTSVAFVDGNDWLALVNRSPTGALAPDYAPTDLVDVKDLRPRTAGECGAQRECLRHDAAVALHTMLDALHHDGLEGVVQSAFRAFSTQCWVFESWAHQARGGFCEATEQSALPGHSQHQLGTTLDLFTRKWADDGARTGQGVFRNGFGCSEGGRWLDEHSWRFGFVVPYPIHPDDRLDGSRCLTRTDRPVPIDPKTGYKSEPWHVRFLGVDAAARYHGAWLASGPGTPDEITLEQWLRSERGLTGDTELPVCDGCQCGACATLAENDARTPCSKASLWLDDVGRVVSPAQAPRLVDAVIVPPAAKPAAGHSPRLSRRPETETPARGKVIVLEAEVAVPEHTPTQPPVEGREGPVYATDATYLSLVPYPGTEPHRYPELPGAWRLAVEALPVAGTLDHSSTGRSASVPHAVRWPWRASLASAALEDTWNRANVVLPATAGEVKVRISLVVPEATRSLAVTLIRDGVEHDTRNVALP